MFGWHDEKGGSKVFWFQETKAGNQKLVRPDGTSRIIKKKHEYFVELGKQASAGWQRAMLLMDEYGIWDATAFGCTMNTLIGVRKKFDPYAYIFCSCQNAERAVYPVLSEEQVEICRKNVDDFYQNPNLQAAWHDFILHPVCLKVTRDLKEVVPVSIESIGCGQGALGRYRFEPVGAINDKESIGFLFGKSEEEIDFEE